MRNRHVRSLGRSHQGRSHRGFTLFEALIAIVIAAMAASTLLLGITSSIQTTEFGNEQATALGIAEQMADEIVGKLYAGSGENPYTSSLGPNGSELTGNRLDYDDIDDFHNFTAKPPKSPLAITLGEDNGEGAERHPNFRLTPPNFNHWREYVEVYYVSDSDPTVRLATGLTSGLKAVEVHILKDIGGGVEKEAANVRRVLGYIPSP